MINRIVARLRAFRAFLAEDLAKALTSVRLPAWPASNLLSYADLLRVFQAVRTVRARGEGDEALLPPWRALPRS